MSIIVLGTVALDNVKTPFGKREGMLGGSAAHFAMSARLFTKVNLVAIVGEDFPQEFINLLRGKGIILTSLVKDQGKTFEWDGEYRGDLNTAITLKTQLGVLSTFKPEISTAQKHIEYVFLANVDPDIQMHVLKSIYAPKLVGLDTMNYWIDNKRKALLRVLKKIDIFVVNDQEARSLSGESSLIKAAKCLSSYGPEMVLVKKGEHGALFYCDKFIFSISAFPIHTVIDPTGAGDTFAGGFMGYLAKRKRLDAVTIKKAVAYGTVAASFNVEGFGIERTMRFRLADLNTRLEKLRRHLSF